MSGHSKWAGIKHKKAIVDAKRGQAFTRASREITIAAKEGGGDTEANFRLRLAVQKAREVNMPADKIQGAIDRGTGAGKGDSLEELRYEGYGPVGVAILVDAMTDNRNRTSASLKHIFAKYGGNMAESNAVAWMFDRKGIIELDPAGKDPDDIGLAAIEAGAEDIQVENAEITMHPKQTVPVEEEKVASVLRLLEHLEEDDDVQQVYANFDIPADVLERVSAQV